MANLATIFELGQLLMKGGYDDAVGVATREREAILTFSGPDISCDSAIEGHRYAALDDSEGTLVEALLDLGALPNFDSGEGWYLPLGEPLPSLSGGCAYCGS